MLIPVNSPLYIAPVSYRDLYYNHYAKDEKSQRDIMEENCKYALKIAYKLHAQEKYLEAKYYFEESIKCGSNKRMIWMMIADCERKYSG